MIYECLLELYSIGAQGIVDSVVFLGLPQAVNFDDWKKFRQIAAGRIINGFLQSDILLGFLFRTSSLSFKDIAGTSSIELEFVESFDLSDIVSSHLEYPNEIARILARINFT